MKKRKQLTQKLINKVTCEAEATLKEQEWIWLTSEFATIDPYVVKADDGKVVLRVINVHDDVMANVEYVTDMKCWRVSVLALYLLDKFQPSWVPVIKDLMIDPDVPGAVKEAVISALGSFQERVTRLAKAAAEQMILVIKEKKDGY